MTEGIREVNAADDSHDPLDLFIELFPEAIERTFVSYPMHEVEWLPPQLREVLRNPELTREMFMDSSDAFWVGFWLACEKPDRRRAE